MDQQLQDRLAELLAAGQGERVGSETYLPILGLESDTRYGLCSDGSWVAHRPNAATLVRLAEGTEPHFCEAVECKRATFEELLAAGAKTLGLDPEALTFSFPSVAVVRALLHRQSVHFTRLALLWLGLILAQVLLGAATIWTNKAADVATAHVLVGALALALGAILSIVSFRQLMFAYGVTNLSAAAETRPLSTLKPLASGAGGLP